MAPQTRPGGKLTSLHVASEIRHHADSYMLAEPAAEWAARHSAKGHPAESRALHALAQIAWVRL
eukprot:5194301-Alexandrium_andersonii.AAC.1